MGDFEEKVTRKIPATFLYACLQNLKQIVRRIGEKNVESYKDVSKTKKKKKKKAHEEIDFYNSIQD